MFWKECWSFKVTKQSSGPRCFLLSVISANFEGGLCHILCRCLLHMRTLQFSLSPNIDSIFYTCFILTSPQICCLSIKHKDKQFVFEVACIQTIKQIPQEGCAGTEQGGGKVRWRFVCLCWGTTMRTNRHQCSFCKKFLKVFSCNCWDSSERQR